MELDLICEASLNKLARSNKKITNKRARSNKIKVKLKAYNKSNGKAKFEANGLTNEYDIFVDFLKPQSGILLARQEVKLSCSCPDFKFRCNQVLSEKHDSAERRYDNGEKPKITNPDEEQILCKHLVKLKNEFKNLRFTDNLNIKRVR
jgi:hypothetical protein